MSSNIITKLTLTICSIFFVLAALGMVLTVSADRSEQVSITKAATSVIVPPGTIISADGPSLEQLPTSTLSPNIATSIELPESLTAAKEIPRQKNISRTISKTTPVTVKPAVTTKTADAQQISFTNTLKQRIFELTNEFRISEGLPSLLLSPTLTKNATTYSAIMIKNNRLSHTDVLGCSLTCRFKRDNYQAQAWGENLAYYSFEDEPTVEAVAQFFMSEWKKSSGHRANLVSLVFTETGIGISKNDESIYVAVHFALP